MDTWTCMVCTAERPDNKISVFSTTTNVNGVQIGHNVRYCNDRPDCAAGAPAVTTAFIERLRDRSKA